MLLIAYEIQLTAYKQYIYIIITLGVIRHSHSHDIAIIIIIWNILDQSDSERTFRLALVGISVDPAIGIEGLTRLCLLKYFRSLLKNVWNKLSWLLLGTKTWWPTRLRRTVPKGAVWVAGKVWAGNGGQVTAAIVTWL